ncbi:MAG: hypothetical protein HF314_13960 [Ignavibacteria bacterium]|nr:hypothetical protein [Ignavibacteria bacterium]
MPFIRTIVPILFLFILSSCNFSDEPSSTQDRLNMYLIDASVKEVYLRVSPGNRFRDIYVTLQRNNLPVQTFRVNKDTVICDTALSGGTTYTYQLTEGKSGTLEKLSEKVMATTLTPTSHNISWQTFDFGIGNMDQALDVSIIDENNVWVSGDFTVREAGEDKYYNLLKWDGSKWTYEVAENEREGYYYGVLYSIFSFSKSDIWVGNNTPGHWAGDKWNFYGVETGYPKPTGRLRKIWGTNSSNMYFAGEDGSVVKYDGKSWRLLNAGSIGYTADMCGYKDELTGEEVVYCPYSINYNPMLSKVIRITSRPNSIEKVELIGFPDEMVPLTVWTHKGYPVYAGGSGLFYYTQDRWKDAGLKTDKYIQLVRGNALNDIFVTGWGLLAHYNGIEWKTYEEFSGSWDAIFSMDVKGNTIAVVGIHNGRVAVAIVKRN